MMQVPNSIFLELPTHAIIKRLTLFCRPSSAQTASHLIVFVLKSHFEKLSATRIKKRNREDVVSPELVIRRHSGVIGLSACILAFPYQVPDFMPKLLMLLSEHVNDPQPIQVGPWDLPKVLRINLVFANYEIPGILDLSSSWLIVNQREHKLFIQVKRIIRLNVLLCHLTAMITTSLTSLLLNKSYQFCSMELLT